MEQIIIAVSATCVIVAVLLITKIHDTILLKKVRHDLDKIDIKFDAIARDINRRLEHIETSTTIKKSKVES